MSSSLKYKAAKGFFWSLTEKISIMGGQFIIGIILARMLSPGDFGIFTILSFFIAISYILIDGGLERSLLQKQDCTDADFSTVFVYNLIISVVVYLIIYLCAPYVAKFYGKIELVSLMRVLAVSLVLQALAVVQNSKFIIGIDFKKLAKINVISVFGGGVVAIIAAWYNLGVWALVIQTIVRSLLYLLLNWFLGEWYFSFKFFMKSFNSLFRYGSNLMIARIVSEITSNIYNVVIGKFYLISELGEYNRSKSFSNLFSSTISHAIQQVSFPILSSIQNEKIRFNIGFKRVIKMSAFISFPILTALSLFAEPLVRILLTEKWLMAVPLLKWMAFSRMFYSINASNINVLNVIGRSDLFLKLDLIKFTYIIVVMIIAIPMGIKAMVIGQVINGVLSFFVNAFLSGKYINYGIGKQLKDFIPYAVATILMALVLMLLFSLVKSLYVNLVVGFIIGAVVYYIACKLLNVSEIKEIERYVLDKVKQFK